MIKKIAIALLVVAGIVLFDQLGGREYLLPATYRDLYASQPVLTAAIFFGIYVLVTALSIPGAAVMTLLGGAIFGLWTGTLLVSFASSIGATLAFLFSRVLLRDWVQSKFSSYLQGINEGVKKDGVFYLLSLRLVPIIPFFVINLVMGLTPIRTVGFYLASQIGMLPGTLVYVYAGSQLGAIDELSPAGILTPALIGSFVLLGVFPFIVKWVMGRIQRARVYRPWRSMKPKTFDRNLVVIGAGSAGLVSAYIASAVKANVTLIEKAEMGGDCLNTGCVPSKALIRSAKIKHYMDDSRAYGIQSGDAAVDFPAIMARVHKVIGEIAPHDSVERYTELGVECIKGEAEVLSPWSVKVGDRTLSTRNIIIATGAEPFVPPIPGIKDIDYLTSDSLWSLQELPQRLLVVGGGPIGCEIAQAFCRLGSKVTIADMAPRLMPREDADAAAHVTKRFIAEGITVLTDQKTTGFARTAGGASVTMVSGETTSELEFDQVLIAVGRAARTTGYGFDALELTKRGNRTLEVNEYLQTRFPNVYACGDVTGPFQFTHVAAHQAWYASVNALFGEFRKFKADYRVIPWATFTDPEVARVGLSEDEAKEKGIEYELTRYGLDDLDRAIADGAAEGFVKVLTVPGKDKILGATIVGVEASNLIAEFVLAMKYNLGLNKILGTIHLYPSLAEANKYVAGEWKRAHAPEGILRFIQKLHRWRLS